MESLPQAIVGPASRAHARACACMSDGGLGDSIERSILINHRMVDFG